MIAFRQHNAHDMGKHTLRGFGTDKKRRCRYRTKFCDLVISVHISSVCTDGTASVLDRDMRGTTSGKRSRHSGDRAPATASVANVAQECVLAIPASQMFMQHIVKPQASPKGIAPVWQARASRQCGRNPSESAPLVCLQHMIIRNIMETLILEEVQP